MALEEREVLNWRGAGVLRGVSIGVLGWLWPGVDGQMIDDKS